LPPRTLDLAPLQGARRFAAGTCPWLGWLWLALVLSFSQAAWSADSTTFRTNYYSVTGATMREVRESIARNRPWRQSSPMDGRTDWTIRWRSNLDSSGQGARVLSTEVTATITVTLPSWKPPEEVSEDMLERWKRYFANLKRHEDGHVAIALQAAAAVRQRTSAIREAPTVQELQRLIDRAGHQAMEEFKAKEKEYDRITQHGVNQDAWRP